MTVDELEAGVLTGWKKLTASKGGLVLTFARRSAGLPAEWAAWLVRENVAVWVTVDVFDDASDHFAPLAPGWPISELADTHVTVIGVGSIGSAAAEGLASYGIRHLALIDRDRLFAHNFARHRALRDQLGRLKVNAVADLLTNRDPLVDVEKFPLDIASNADRIRPLLQQTDLVLGCPDGTRARRTASHLAFWAHKPVVLACVLEQGAFGEVLRLVPGRTGCLLCNRRALEHAFDPEPGLDAGYESNDPHRPMTAVTGDLSLVGQLAAKVAIATLRERQGDRGQKLENDHALLALRPVPDFPAPFDFKRAGDIHWTPTAPSRSECPSCGEGR